MNMRMKSDVLTRELSDEERELIKTADGYANESTLEYEHKDRDMYVISII